MMKRFLVILFGVCAACDGAVEAPRVDVAVVGAAGEMAAVTNDLGWSVALSEARMALGDLTFSVAGETHAASGGRGLLGWLVPGARAHPGHAQGGGVTGELRGRFVVQWWPASARELGTATLLAGNYTSANFTFLRAMTDDGLAPDDPLVGRTAVLAGRATRGATAVDFVARIDAPGGRVLVGAPFEASVAATTVGTIELRLLVRDPAEGDTLFDGIDFGALAIGDDGRVTLTETSPAGPAADAYNRLRRTFMTHDHFDLQPSWSQP